MKLIILLTKEDVQTVKNGSHYEIRSDNVTINFSPEALDEFLNDIKELSEPASKQE